MDLIELLKGVGLTQYEAEAYSTLLREGPLTGYELGKRSRVPLPRSYDVLNRLVDRGLALVQPGDPPRYLAEDASRFLDHLRSTAADRLNALEAELAAIMRPTEDDDGFWVLRGREGITERLVAMIRAAESSVELMAPLDLDDVLVGARRRGCQVTSLGSGNAFPNDVVLTLIDGRELLTGTLGSRAQAVVTRNRALVALARSCFATERPESMPTPAGATAQAAGDWLAWETEKHRRLRLLAGGADVA